MHESLLIGVTAIIALGILSYWIAWRIHLPAILVLLLVGFIAGPLTNFLNPDQIFGNVLFPLISISVAIILFEGGLSLQIKELKETKEVVRNLVSIGVIITWIIGIIAAYFILKLSFSLSLLLGAIIIVTGPTVIIPMLQHLHLVSRIGSVAKWEGIINDPIGAILAVLMFEVIMLSGTQAAVTIIAFGILKTVFIGVGLGIAGAYILIFLLKRYWIPDFLQNPITLMIVVLIFASSNVLQSESGLVAVTVMGIILANQRRVLIKHIIEFKENLRVLLISSLFILLASRLQISDLQYINFQSIAFLGVLIFIARPAAVFLSTIGSKMNIRERLFLLWMAPRGIVAAAVSSIFAFELTKAGIEEAQVLKPVIFLVIIGTVVLYGLTASPVAKWLNLAKPNPQGVLILGAHNWARAIAKILQKEGFQVCLVDSNWANISAARLEGMSTYYGSVISEQIFDELDLAGVGKMLALTPNDEINNLAILHFMGIFDRSELYQLSHRNSDAKDRDQISPHLTGRILFSKEITHNYLTRRFNQGAKIKSIQLTEKFDFKTFQEYYHDNAVPLFLKTEDNDLEVFATDNPPEPAIGHTLICLVDEEGKS
jgi:NhaP-type Na+/H+ or K+/H+ antiporter